MPKKKPKKGEPEVHKDLKGFDIKINEFGQLITNFEVDKLNSFLNENLSDKKLQDHQVPEESEEEE